MRLPCNGPAFGAVAPSRFQRYPTLQSALASHVVLVLQSKNLEQRVAELTAELEGMRNVTEKAQCLLEENQSLKAALAWHVQTQPRVRHQMARLQRMGCENAVAAATARLLLATSRHAWLTHCCTSAFRMVALYV